MTKTGEYAALNAWAKEKGKALGLRITVVNRQGVVLADSEQDPQLMENHRFRPEIKEAFSGKIGQSYRFSQTVKEKMLYIGVPVKKGSEIAYVLRLSKFAREIDNSLIKVRLAVIEIVLIFLLISFVFSGFFSFIFTQPIEELKDAFGKLTKGNLDVQVNPFRRQSEFRELAREFNFMASSLKEKIDEINFHKNELQAVFSAIEEGLVVVDQEGKIILVNDRWQKTFHAENARGYYLWEIIRVAEIGELFKSTQTKSKHELQWEGRFFQVLFIPFGSKGEMLISFRDITDFKRLEQIKRDFVINVSHELRTPLTALKGFVELIEPDVKGEAKKYLEIIKRNTERMIHIVTDLLILAQIEDRKENEGFSKVELKEVSLNVLKLFENRAQEKRIALRLECPYERLFVYGDSYQLEQLLINLIDNAIKYTEKGEVVVRLTQDNGGQVALEVSDTGSGIPKKHLQRIFERFYVVDKSRSRELGGTGLGLSIVKHIVLNHKGKIEVKSAPGQGTTFKIIFPTSE